MKNKIIIVGAGIAGLSIATYLVRGGAKVVLIDKGIAGGETSQAAAGMITPVSEVRFGEENLLKLFLASLSYYPQFIADVELAAGITTDFYANGSLMIAIDQDDEAELTRLFDYQKSLGLDVKIVEGNSVAVREPLLTSQCALALETPGEYCVDNLRLIQALKNVFVRRGGQLMENTTVQKIQVKNQKVTGVVINKRVIMADKVVMATGVSNSLPGLDLAIPLRPVKGQALELKNRARVSLTRPVRTLHRYPVYLVPRSDGRIIVGATSEEMGLDARVTAGAQLDLLYGAWKIMPSIEDMEITHTWVGHRATTPDHAPILGPCGIDGLILAMGLYRHGFLLSPIIGKLMSELLINEKFSEFFDQFGISRFALNGKEKVA